MELHQAAQPTVLTPLEIDLYPECQQVLVDQVKDMKQVSYDYRIAEVLLDDSARGLGQSHHNDTHLLLARQILQMATQIESKRSRTTSRTLWFQIHQRLDIAPFAGREVLNDGAGSRIHHGPRRPSGSRSRSRTDAVGW